MGKYKFGGEVMKNKKLIFTYIMFGISCMLTLFWFVFIILSIVIIKFVSPVIFFIILTGLFILLTIHYYKCIKLLKNNNFLEEKKVLKLKNTNSVLAFIFGFMSFTMLSVAIYPMIVLGGWIDFCLYFIIVGVLCGFYTINLLMNNKNNM